MEFKYCDSLLPPGGGLCLEVGARNAAYQKVAEERGYRYVGVDIEFYRSLSAVGDVHRLPFSDNLFDAVLLPCVLEHFIEPRVALREVYRVLKPGGLVCGQVAFIEPFHKSYFHFSHWATAATLKETGFKGIFLDAGVNGFVLLWNRISGAFRPGKGRYGHLIARMTFPINLALMMARGVLLLKNVLLRRDLRAFHQRFDNYVRNFALSLAGHILFLAYKRDA